MSTTASIPTFISDGPDSAMIAAMGVLTPVTGEQVRAQRNGSPTSRLLEGLERHADSEALSIAQARRLAQKSPDPVVAFLMKLIVADEERHHRLLKGLAVRLHDSMEWTHSPGALPTGAPATAASPRMIEITRQRLREERESIAYLERIARENKTLYDGLFKLLLQVMILDSQKHERMLEFILQRLEKGANA